MKNTIENQVENTKTSEYTDSLIKKQTIWWKRLLDVQAPYRWNLRRLEPGFTLDIGSGIGRNLMHLKGHGVGIDHNVQSIRIARERGLAAFTPEEFRDSEFNLPKNFDSILLAHVAEHMTQQEAVKLVRGYLDLLKPQGKLIMITPQEAGYKSDSTHIEFIDFSKLRTMNEQLGFKTSLQYSFPFPRFIGRFFTYNEFVSVGLKK